MSLLDLFNEANKGLEENGGKVNQQFKQLDSGRYPVELVDVQHQVTPWGQEQLSVRIGVIAGKDKGVNEFVRLNLDSSVSEAMAKRHMGTLIQLSRVCGIAITPGDLNGSLTNVYERLALKFQPALHRRFTMDLKVSPNKKNPDYPYRNYEFSNAETLEQDMQQPQQEAWGAQPQQQNWAPQQGTPMPTEDDMPF